MKRIFGLVGFPLEHSWSKKFFNKKFESEGIDNAWYENFPLEDISSFRQLVETNPNIAGLNVTIPYKEKIISYIDELDPTAKVVGAVNTIKLTRNRGVINLVGHNTDVIGFEQSLLGNALALKCKALVLGSGGASKAVRFVLEKFKCPHIVASLNPRGGNTLTYAQLTDKIIKDHQLIINTTPLGMFPNIDSMPDIPYGALTSNHLLFDLVYNPIETRFLKMGKQAGSKTISGLEMLHLQALAAWEIWNA